MLAWLLYQLVQRCSTMSESGPQVNFSRVKSPFLQGGLLFCITVPVFQDALWKEVCFAWLQWRRATVLPNYPQVKTNGIVPMQLMAFEILQIIPDSIWRSVSYPSAPEGALNLSPSLLSCSWNNLYCFCQGKAKGRRGRKEPTCKHSWRMRQHGFIF